MKNSLSVLAVVVMFAVSACAPETHSEKAARAADEASTAAAQAVDKAGEAISKMGEAGVAAAKALESKLRAASEESAEVVEHESTQLKDEAGTAVRDARDATGEAARRIADATRGAAEALKEVGREAIEAVRRPSEERPADHAAEAATTH